MIKLNDYSKKNRGAIFRKGCPYFLLLEVDPINYV
jgi:hypothetical protein